MMGKEGSPTNKEDLPPVLGRVLRLELQPASRLTWLGPAWAALCGAVASGQLTLTLHATVTLVLTLFLADSVLGTIWSALSAVGHRWLDSAPDVGEPGSQPRSMILKPATTSLLIGVISGLDGVVARLPNLTWLVQEDVRTLLLVTGIGGTLALALGTGVAVMVALGLVFPLFVAFALGGHPLRGGLTRAVLEIGLPWAIGVAAFRPFPVPGVTGVAGLALATLLWVNEQRLPLLMASLFTVTYFGALTLNKPARLGERLGVLILPQMAVIGLLVTQRTPVMSGAALVLFLAQLLFQPHLRPGHVRWYLQATQWFVMGLMLAAAIGVAL